jgi:hypothetical protein
MTPTTFDAILMSSIIVVVVITTIIMDTAIINRSKHDRKDVAYQSIGFSMHKTFILGYTN